MQNKEGQTLTEYILIVALLTVVAIIAYIPLADGILAFTRLPFFSGEESSRKMIFNNPIPCAGGKDSMKGGVKLSTYSAGSNSVHGVSWCSGSGDGSNEIGNSLNKLSIQYPDETDLSDVDVESVDVKLDKDGDGEYEKNASDDISEINTDGNNLVLTLTGQLQRRQKGQHHVCLFRGGVTGQLRWAGTDLHQRGCTGRRRRNPGNQSLRTLAAHASVNRSYC